MAQKPRIELNLQPHAKQHQAYQKLLDDTTSALLFGGAANGGKSWIGCEWLIIMCLMYPGTGYFIGREELKRLRTTTLRTFFKVAKFHGLAQGKIWEYKAGGDQLIKFHNGSYIDLLDLKYLPSDPMYERYGSSEWTCGWIEEGGEIHYACFDVLRGRVGRLSNEKYNIKGKLLVTANPKQNWMYNEFYKPYRDGNLPEEYAFIQSLPEDNIYREKGSLEALQGLKITSQKERLLYGNWDYVNDPDQLIHFDLITQNIAPLPGDYVGEKKLGVDVARYGTDASSIAHKKGRVFIWVKKYKGFDTQQLKKEIIKQAQLTETQASDINIDAVGIGAGVVDGMNEMGWYVKEIQSGASADQLSASQFKFKNLRSQLWWQFKEGLDEGFIKFDPMIQSSEYWDELCEDLMAPRYKVVNDRYIQIESKDDIKKRLGRSPDVGESLIYAEYSSGFNLLI